MASFTSRLRLIKLLFRDKNWHTNLNALIDMLDEAFGVSSVDLTADNVTLTALDNASDQSRPMCLELTGTPGAARNVTVPNKQRILFVKNSSNANVILRAGTFITTVTIAPATLALIKTDGAGNVTSLVTSGGILGFGTLAIQSAAAVAITGGTIAGVTLNGTITFTDRIVGDRPGAFFNTLSGAFQASAGVPTALFTAPSIHCAILVTCAHIGGDGQATALIHINPTVGNQITETWQAGSGTNVLSFTLSGNTVRVTSSGGIALNYGWSAVRISHA